MDGSNDEVVPRRKTPTAAPPPLPEAPRAVEPNTVEGAGVELVPIPSAPPPPPARPAPRPAPVAAPRPPARHYVPKRRTPRRESTGGRPRRRGGRKMLVALAVLISAGAAAAAMGRGGVTESRGVTGEPTREFRAPRRKPQVDRVAQPRVDSALTASVRDSVALLLGRPPVQEPPAESPEVNVPARVDRRGRPVQQREQGPSGSALDTRQAEPQPPSLPAVNFNQVGDAAEVSAANARARIDSVTRREAKTTFSTRVNSAARP